MNPYNHETQRNKPWLVLTLPIQRQILGIATEVDKSWWFELSFWFWYHSMMMLMVFATGTIHHGIDTSCWFIIFPVLVIDQNVDPHETSRQVVEFSAAPTNHQSSSRTRVVLPGDTHFGTSQSSLRMVQSINRLSSWSSPSIPQEVYMHKHSL